MTSKQLSELITNPDNQDGFTAVKNQAAEAAAAAGGSSHKFRLTRKKQSRKSNKKTRNHK